MSKLRQRGFTLIELVMFIVIVGLGVAGVLSVFTTSVASSADPMIRKQALAIAESLLEEILLKDFVDPNGGTNGVSTCNLAGGANRSLWDDVCDYNTYTSTGIRDVQGNTIAALANYNVLPEVAITTVNVGGVPLKRVVVSVTDTQNNVISIVGFRGNDR
jgi:MSHA pilin protein MshD